MSPSRPATPALTPASETPRAGSITTPRGPDRAFTLNAGVTESTAPARSQTPPVSQETTRPVPPQNRTTDDSDSDTNGIDDTDIAIAALAAVTMNPETRITPVSRPPAKTTRRTDTETPVGEQVSVQLPPGRPDRLMLPSRMFPAGTYGSVDAAAGKHEDVRHERGAARAAAHALAQAGAAVRIVNRTAQRAERLAADIGPAVIVSRSPEAFGDAVLVVNALSAPPDLDVGPLETGTVVMDMTYRPLVTPLLAAAQARGLPTVDGLAMLIGQARPSFRALFGVEPPPAVDVRARALALLGEAA